MADGLNLVFAHFQHQFVVDLHDHTGVQRAVVKPLGDLDHGALDDIGSGALHRCVDRGALGSLAHGLVLGMNFRQVQAATEQGFDVALLAGLLAGAFHIAQHARVAGEVAVNVSLRLLAIDTDLFGQTKGTHAVDQAEVDGLGAAALVGGDLLQVHAEYLGSGCAVHIEIMAEGVQQTGILCQMRHDPQLDLRVVRRQQFVALWRDKGLANAAAFGGADRDVLQVRIRGRQATRCRHRLMIGGMDASGTRVDLLRQAVGVGAFEFADAAVLHDHLRQLEALLGQFCKHRLGGRWLALGGFRQHRQALLFIQDGAQLLG